MVQKTREEKESIISRSKQIAKRLFKTENLLLYIVSIAISMVTFLDEMNPFSMSYLAAVYLAGIPIFGVMLCTSIGILITFGKASLLMYILSAIVFIGMAVVIKAKKMDEETEIGIKLFLSVMLVGLVKNIGNRVLIYDTLMLLTSSICTVIFFIIFSKAMPILSERKIKKACTKEELIATSILAVIAISALGDFQIAGFIVRDILSILVILILGWKNGALVGTAAGISVSVILAVAGLGNTETIASYAFSGLLAGIFRKFGKLGVVAGFIIGNIILTYISNVGTYAIISIKEILIASVALLVIPRKLESKIEDIITVNNILPEGSPRALGQVENTIYALNNISEVFDDMTKINDDLEKEQNDITEFLNTACNNTCKQCTYNKKCLKNLIDEEDEANQKLIKILDLKEKITEEDLYIVYGEDCCILVNKITENINFEYPTYKLNVSWKKKIEENKKIAINQLKGVSKTLNNVVKDLYENDVPYNDFSNLKLEIKKELDQEKINIKDIIISKDKEKYEISIYKNIKQNENNSKTYTIEKILSKIIGQKIVASKHNYDIQKNNGILIQKYVSEPNYKISLGVSRTTKNRSMVSGDSSTFMELPDGKFLIALSDGMGSRS